MTEFAKTEAAAGVVRPTEEQFADVEFARRHPCRHLDWAVEPFEAPLRLAVIDEPAVAPANGLADGAPNGVFLLLHGEPSWSALYEQWIPALCAAGYRCVAVDLPGFGRSDKPTDDTWYRYERHVAAVAHVIDTLDLRDIHLVVQDWAGPIGLRQLVDRPERFARTFVFNTWLHHDGHHYGDGVRRWRAMAIDPDRFGDDMPTGRIVAGTMRRPGHDLAALTAVYDAPFGSREAKAGARAFPTMLPFAEPERGGASEQARCHAALCAAPPCPMHLAFGDADPVFPYEQGEVWAAQIPGATIDRIPGAGHFVQADAPQDCLEVIWRRLGREGAVQS